MVDHLSRVVITETVGPQSLKYLLLGPFQKKLAELDTLQINF